MTICFFTRSFYPNIGGVERHILEISKILAKKNHKIIIIAEGSGLDKRLQIKNIDTHYIKTGRNQKLKKLTIWIWLWKHRSLFLKADVLHAHDVYFWYLPFRFLYLTKRSYVTFHGYESYPIKFKAILIRKLSELCSNGNICIGDFIRKWYKTKPSFVSYGGVNPILTHKRPFTRSAIFIGRLDEQTGIETYEDAVGNIRKDRAPFTFAVVGDGPLKQSLSTKDRLLGFVEAPEKLMVTYRFAFVSRYLAMLEAMAAKRLVFAVYDNPVKEDYLKMSPFSNFAVIVKNPKDLSDKIIYFLNHRKEEEEIIEKAYSWAKKQTWENVTELYLRLWGVSS